LRRKQAELALQVERAWIRALAAQRVVAVQHGDVTQ
jgi:hypothetical protein